MPRSARLAPGGGIADAKEWPLWEVFVRAKNGLSHRTSAACMPPMRDGDRSGARHLHAAHGRDQPVGGAVGSHHRIRPRRSGALFAPAADKVYRHPTFYSIPDTSRTSDGRREQFVSHALRLGDDALILGQRLSEWCGHAPMLEIDLALANIGLDLVGQATLFLGLAGEAEGGSRDADALAFYRDVLDFKNCLLVEQPNGDFAQTIARQFLFSNWQELLMREIAAAPEPRLCRHRGESRERNRLSRDFANEWVVRLGDGTEESRARMIAGLDWMWRFVDELFDPKDGAPSHRAEWDARIARVLASAGLELPKPRRGVLGGRKITIPSISGICCARCSSSRAPTRERCGETTTLWPSRNGIRDPQSRSRSGNSVCVGGRSRDCARGKQPHAVHHADLHRLSRHDRDCARHPKSARRGGARGSTNIETVLAPPWTTDWISDEGREKLRAYGIAPPPKGAAKQSLGEAAQCPRCGSSHSEEISRFGSTPCKALHRCLDCREPFDRFKCH